ncbi:MAG TPA: inositol-3-phosphate synthase [Phycisphaerae bacterium]|nr:inositol-3-phosphate synthase [Phycisphaerae bacterium]
MRHQNVRVAIVGAGNCASSLVQGVHFYRHASDDDFVPGLMHVTLGPYHVSHIEFSAAFDISAAKVGLDLSKAIFAPPNNTYRFSDVPPLNVPVLRGPSLDGLGKYLHDVVPESSADPVDVARILRQTRTDVLVIYLPVGSEKAAAWYAEQALEAGCALVNCIPVFIASRPHWAKRFEDRGLPLIGDDIKSQLGATITHRVLTHLFRERGVRLDRTYQLNFGGNTDFLNMLERERLESKKISKTNAVTSQLDYTLPHGAAHVGPSDYVPWLEDRKFCYIRMEGTTFGNVPLSCELKLEVWDSPNSAGVVIDAVRCAKIALDRGIAGPLIGPSSYLMKSPPLQFSDSEAHDRTEAFIRGPVAPAAEPPPQAAPPRPLSSHDAPASAPFVNLR